MGYGHLRPAHALAERLDVEVLEADRQPLAGAGERRVWRTARRGYEAITRASQRRLGAPLRALLGAITDIPELEPDLSSPSLAVETLELFIRRGLGAGMLEQLRASDAPLLTTFYTPAVIADGRCENDIYCVVTDADINRVWAPADAASSRIRYLVPSERAALRLRAFGVPPANVELTGFPLPHELLGGRELPTLRRNLAHRLARLDPTAQLSGGAREEIEETLGPLPEDTRAPLLTFAVGGTGSQTELVARFLPSLAPAVRAGRLRLALVAGVRLEVAERLRSWLRSNRLAGEGVEVLHRRDFASYVRAFNELVARTDILWTKPSEMTFFAALGLPLVLSEPIGDHERYNREWAVGLGAGRVQGEPRRAGDWLLGWIDDGTLATAAWSGYQRLPKRGLYRILDAIGSGPTATLTGAESTGDQVGHA
jgi:hypothetical protein